MQRKRRTGTAHSLWCVTAAVVTVTLAGCGGAALVAALTSGVGGLITGALVGAAIQVRRVEISPQNPTVPVGAVVKFTAEAVSTLGNQIPAKEFDWNVSNQNVGTIDSNGVFTAVSEGTVVISVNMVGLTGSNSGSTTVVVSNTVGAPLVTLSLYPADITLPVGANFRLVPVATSVKGFPQDAPGLTWGVPTGASYGTVNSQGIFTATAPTPDGQPVVVRATVGSLADISNITVKSAVTPGPLAAIYVLPPSVLLPTNSTFTFYAYGLDKDGNYIPLTGITWSTTGDIGTVDANGILTTGAAEKDGQVVATVGSVQGLALVNVRNGS